MKASEIPSWKFIHFPIFALLVLGLAGCGDSGGGGSGGLVRGFSVYQPDSPTYEADISIQVGFILSDEIEDESSQTVQLEWHNKTTGEFGSAEQYISRSCTWLVVFVLPIPTCQTSGQSTGFSLHLAMGNNEIEVTAAGHKKSVTVKRIKRPASPKKVSVQTVGDDIIVTWDDVLLASYYNIYYASNPGVTKSNYLTLPDGNKISYATSPQVITGLTAGVDYYFVVTWGDIYSESKESKELSAHIIGFELSFDIKTFRFTWADEPNATHYRILENPDGYSGYSQVGSDIPQATEIYDHIVPLYNRINASYILQSCAGTDCTDFGPFYIDNNLVDAIGYFKAGNTGPHDGFGNSVSLSGDGNTLAVGSPREDDVGIFDSGAVYIFNRIGSDWNQQAYIMPSIMNSYAYFGGSVSLSDDGNILAVGARGDDVVYIYSRSGNDWNLQAYVKASNTEIYDDFGYSISLSGSGNTLAVGATGEDSSTSGINTIPDNLAETAGAVYVFSRSGSDWSQQAYIKADKTEINDYFGSSVSLSNDGDTLAVGSGIYAVWPVYSKAVYLFSRSGSEWSQEASIETINSGSEVYEGTTVSLSGDGNTVVFNATDDEAVYVFDRSGSDWSQQAYIKAGNAEQDDIFGYSISLSGDGNTLAVGATGEDSGTSGINTSPDNLLGSAGAAYVFSRSGSDWSQQAYIKSRNPGWSDRFGNSISLSDDGNTLAVGAQEEDSSTTGINSIPDDLATNAGAVYLY